MAKAMPKPSWRCGEANRFVIQRKGDGLFLGMAGLHADDGYEFGYWLGKPFWGFGYATEAAHRLVTYAFEALGLETSPCRLVLRQSGFGPCSGQAGRAPQWLGDARLPGPGHGGAVP